MGGSAGPGNHSAAAEFNAAVDSESINMCFDALEAVGVPLHMVGLDACRQVRVNAGDARKQREAGVTRIHLAECAHVLSDLLLGYVRMAGADGASPMALYDPTAAAALVAPDAMQWRPARVVAECHGGAHPRHDRGGVARAASGDRQRIGRQRGR